MKPIEILYQTAKEIKLQDYLQAYHDITGLGCTISLIDGHTLFEVGNTRLCHVLLDLHSQDAPLCDHAELAHCQTREGGVKCYQCPNGVTEIIKCLYLGEDLIGHAHIGQVLTVEPHDAFLQARSTALNIPLDKIKALYDQLKFMTQKDMFKQTHLLEAMLDQWMLLVQGRMAQEVQAVQYHEKISAHNKLLTMEITQNKRLQEALHHVANTKWQTEGTDFIQKTASFVSRLLDVDMVMISTFEPPDHMRTLAVWDKDHYKENFVYNLKNTPCERVLGQDFKIFDVNVCECFPEDHALTRMKIVSYAGLPLWTHDGQPLGIIAILGRQAFDDKDIIEQVLSTVALRIAHEIETSRQQMALLANQNTLERKVSERTDELTMINEELIATLTELQEAQVRLVEVEKEAAMTSFIKGLGQRINEPLGNLLMSLTFVESLIRSDGLYTSNQQIGAQQDLEEAYALVRKNLGKIIEINQSMQDVLQSYQNFTRERVNMYELFVSTLHAFTVDGETDHFKVTLNIDRGLSLMVYAVGIQAALNQLLSFTRFHAKKDMPVSITVSVTLKEEAWQWVYQDNLIYEALEVDHLFELDDPTPIAKASGYEMHTVYHIITSKLHGHITASKTENDQLQIKMTIPYLDDIKLQYDLP